MVSRREDLTQKYLTGHLMHHIQKDILEKLVKTPSARFSELRPKELDGNIFTYHLRQLIAERYVSKNEDGSYYLTHKGKLAGINIQLSAMDSLKQAHSVLFMAAINDKGEWLLRKRLVQPAYGQAGFIHYEPTAGEPIETTAKKALKIRSGLEADFNVKGTGYISLTSNAELESYIHFTLLVAENVKGHMIQGSPTGENFWYTGDFTEDYMIPSMKDLVSHVLHSTGIFFADLSYELST